MKSKTSINILLPLLIGVIMLHLSIIIKIIPYTIAWGGRLQNDKQMYIFEAISLSVVVFLVFILLIKGNYIKPVFRNKTVDTVLWIYCLLFLLNTIGNIFAKTNFEKLFAILTLIFSILIWNILKNKHSNYSQQQAN